MIGPVQEARGNSALVHVFITYFCIFIDCMSGFHNEYTYRHYVEDGKEPEFDALFENAVSRVKEEILGKTHYMHIGGEKVSASATISEYSPIDKTLVGIFQRGDAETARRAIGAAQKAFAEWSVLDYRARVAIFQKAADIFSQHKFELAAILSIENGKSRYESVGEVDEAIDFLRYYSMDMIKNRGYLRRASIASSSARVSKGFQGAPGSGEKIAIAMKPYGVFGVIAPFNFPVSISMGMSTGAMITGNTVVFKPSSTDNMAMLTGLQIYNMLTQAGLPAGVFNYVTGPGSTLGEELVTNSAVKGIAFTGSRGTGLSMIRKTYDLGMQKVFVVEMGGKNPAIVSKYANLDDAAKGIASAAFGFAGQKCSACSRTYVHESVKEEFMSKLLDEARAMKIGDPLKKENYIGPLISPGALERYKKAVDEASSVGRVVYGGKQVNTGLSGIYVEPTIVEAATDSRLMREELFVPILGISTYRDFGDAIAMANDVGYGLTAGLYSGKNAEIKEFIRKIEAGVIYVNRSESATTGAIVGAHTFVGWKDSGLSGKGSGSRFYLQQFMREQSQAVVK